MCHVPNSLLVATFRLESVLSHSRSIVDSYSYAPFHGPGFHLCHRSRLRSSMLPARFTSLKQSSPLLSSSKRVQLS